MASSMICGAAFAVLATAPAFAQEVEEVVVTGSRIPQPNLTSVSPVQVVGANEIATGGRTNSAEVLNQLPQVFQSAANSLGSTSNPLSGPGGVATVDLRGLGQTRTLVLVDGRRLGIGDPNTGNTNPAPDINQIPAGLIQRVEVLTGGASATYGSDAIAGVVNFIMKRDFEGVQMDAQWGVYQHTNHNEIVNDLLPGRLIAQPSKHRWDGKSRDASIMFGVNAPDGRGNVTAYLAYHDQDPVTQTKRDYSACQVVPTGANAACAGATNSNQWTFLSGGAFGLPGSPTAIAVVGNTFVPWSGTANTTPVPFFNSNEYSYLIQQQTRYNAGYFARYDVTDNFEVYSDFMFMFDRSKVQIAPSGLFQGSGPQSGGYNVNCDNPFLSAQQQGALNCTAADIASGATRTLLIGRRNIEGGGRLQNYEHTNYRFVLGGRGDIDENWSYDVHGSYYTTGFFQTSENYLSMQRAQNALLVRNNAAGTPACISGSGCVPFNIFQDGGVTPQALAYLDITGSNKGSVDERIFEANLTGDLTNYGIKSPWAAEGVGLAMGFHHRRSHLEFAPDSANLSGDLSGAGGASVSVDNSLRVAEGYAEARVPIVSGMSMVEELTAEVAGRYSDYSTGIQAKTWKVGGYYAPIEGYRFRGAYAKAIRAPTIIDLYRPVSRTNTSQVGVDRCASGAPNPATLEQCQRTGITPAQYLVTPNCPSGQCAVLTGGNVLLRPESAKTFTIGLTVRPDMLAGLTLSIDYYDIKMKDQIGTIPLTVTYNRCLAGQTVFCSGIVRGANGSIFGTSEGSGYIDGRLNNVAASRNKGVDFQVTYALPLEDWGVDGIGGLSVNMFGTYMLDASVQPLPGDPYYDCTGLFGLTCGTAYPKWRHTLRMDWRTPWEVEFGLTWRYIGESKNEVDTNEPTIGLGTNNLFNHMLPERSYIDVSARWNVNDAFAVRAGVNNIFDQDPPLMDNRISRTGSPNTYTIYDLLGRKLFVGVTARF